MPSARKAEEETFDDHKMLRAIAAELVCIVQGTCVLPLRLSAIMAALDLWMTRTDHPTWIMDWHQRSKSITVCYIC